MQWRNPLSIAEVGNATTVPQPGSSCYQARGQTARRELPLGLIILRKAQESGMMNSPALQ